MERENGAVRDRAQERDPAERHPGTDVDTQGARRSDGLTGSGPDTSADFTSREEERAAGTPADRRRA